MISYLSGTIILKKDNFIILNVNGVGYEVFLSSHSISKLTEKKDDLSLFCHLDVTERSLKLFGFLSYEELELFKIVRGINGVGPKAALQISSVGSLEKAKEQIDKGDFLKGIPGIGQKRSQTITLELTGKFKTIKKDDFGDKEEFQALVALGFQKERVKKALSTISSDLTTEEKIKKGINILKGT